jgi:NAD-dependent DNA ligase
VSFLRRLLGGSTAGSGTTSTQMNITWFDHLRDDARLQVVGEVYRQANFRDVRPPGPDELPPRLPAPPAGLFKALLVPEPTNPYDRNAVAVWLWAGGSWAALGYVPRQLAPDWQPLFRYLVASDSDPGTRAIACDANLHSEAGGWGVVLHMGSPGECMVERVTKDLTAREGHPFVGKFAALTGELATTIHDVALDRFAQAALIRWAGCELMPRVTKRTDLLIVADDRELSGNYQKAREYAIPTVPEPEFLRTVGVPPDAIGQVTGRWARG